VTETATTLEEGPSIRNQQTAPRMALFASRDWSLSLRRVFWVGIVLFGIQFVIFATWSQVQANRFGLSFDYSLFGETWYLIAHGHIDPFISVKNAAFWRDHSSFLFWATAPLWYLWPHPVTLMWLQDLATVCAEIVGFRWIAELTESARRSQTLLVPASLVVGTGAVLFLANPWIMWSIVNDFHVEIFSVLFVLLAARDFYYDRTRAWVWVVLALLTSNLAATYLVGLALSAFIAGRHWRSRAFGILACGLGWSFFTNVIHGDIGSAFYGYAYLMPGGNSSVSGSLVSVALGVLRHPGRALSQVWQHNLSIWADIGSSGIFGVLSPWVIGVPLVALIENALNSGPDFISPNTGSQNLPEYIFLPIGAIMVFLFLSRSKWRWLRAAMLPSLVLSLVITVGWMVVWIPRTSLQWLTVPENSASTLHMVLAEMPENAEVIASQGIVGNFSTRSWLYAVQRQGGDYGYPVKSPDVWFVITPRLGIELQSVESAYAMISEIANLKGITLENHANGVWAFQWHRPVTTKFVTFSNHTSSINPFDAAASAGTPDLAGPPRQWHVTSNGRTGYIIAKDYFQEVTIGRYRGTARLSSAGPVDVEMWDATTSTLLARATAVNTGGKVENIHLVGYLPTVRGAKQYEGVPPWVSPPPPAYPGDQLELRIWTPGSVTVNVYRLAVTLM
jgi:hypothetical protein